MEANGTKAPASEPVEWGRVSDGWSAAGDDWIIGVLDSGRVVLSVNPHEPVTIEHMRFMVSALEAKLAEVRGE